MTPKERLLTAIDRGKPDRLPVSIHQWQPYHLEEHLGGIGDLEAFERFSMDAQIQYFESMGQFWLIEADFAKFSTSQWRDEAEIVSDDPDDRVVHHTIRTPDGTLTYKTAGDRKTTWLTEYLIKNDDDVRLIDRHMPVPELKLEPIAELYDRIGDRGILRGFVWGDQVGCWQHACCLMDVNALILKCFDQPDWVHDLMRTLLKKKLAFIESMKGAKFDLVETGGGAASSTVISPKLHEEFCLPYDRQIHQALHDLGFKITYHTCGGTRGIEGLIATNGCDVSETLAPPSVGGNQEPWQFAEAVDGRVAMIGGVDQFNVLTEGSRELIGQTVHKLFETVGSRGGYICSLSDHFFETPPEKIGWFAEAARECVY
jgi:uroporphyrinogen-III decarboxylase